MVLPPIMGSKVCGICILSSLQRKQDRLVWGMCVYACNMLYGAHVLPLLTELFQNLQITANDRSNPQMAIALGPL